MSRQHSIVPHRPNYFFIPLEDDYLAMYAEIDDFMLPYYEEHEIKPGPIDCKAMIASVLEAWMNSKRPTAKTMDDLFTYFTYDEWEQALRYRYKRSTIIQCLKEMEIGIQFMDAEGKYGPPMTEYTGTIVKRHFVQNTYEYRLNLPCVLEALAKLPEQSPFDQKPKPALGRPRKNRLKINDINKNGLISDDSRPKTDDGSVKTNDSRPKINAPFYTQITETTQTNTEEGAFAQTPPPVIDLQEKIDERDTAARLKALQADEERRAFLAADTLHRIPAIGKGGSRDAAVLAVGDSDAAPGRGSGTVPAGVVGERDRLSGVEVLPRVLAQEQALPTYAATETTQPAPLAPAAQTVRGATGLPQRSQDGAAPLTGVGTLSPSANASQPRASEAVIPPLSVRDESPRQLTRKQQDALTDTRRKEIQTLVRRETLLDLKRSWWEYQSNREGTDAIIADEWSDEALVTALKAVMHPDNDPWLRNNFDMRAFHKRLPSLVKWQPGKKPAQNGNGYYSPREESRPRRNRRNFSEEVEQEVRYAG